MRCKTDFFNVRLYWEGLKRLRVLGFGVAFLSMTVSAMIPAVYLIDDLTHVYRYEWEPTVRTLQENGYCIPLAFLPWLMPIFVLVMFSFLFKRRESDFYHSIPYTRTCVYTTYTAAVLTCVWVITALCALVSGIFWAVNPYVIFSVGTLVRWTVASGLASTLLCAIMLLAVSLCGNLATTLLNFLVFSTLPRIACFLIGMLLNRGFSSCLIDVYFFMGGFFTMKWFLPLSLMEFANVLEVGADFYDTPVYIYTAAVSVLILIVAGLCYRRRRSETAGNSAPSGKMQHVFRIVFSLPFALIATTMCVEREVMLGGIMIVVFLLIYYLYELITTKQIKRLWKVTPYLGAVLACCLVFLGFYQAIRLGVLYWEIDAEDIEAVEFEQAYCPGAKSAHYDELMSVQSSFRDREIIEKVAETLRYSQALVRRREATYYSEATVHITLKNGCVITRRIWSKDPELADCLWEKVYYRAEWLTLPEGEAVRDVSYVSSSYEDDYYNNLWGSEYFHRQHYEIEADYDVQRFMEMLSSEYERLNDTEKYRVLLSRPNPVEGERVIRIEIVTHQYEHYQINVSPDLLPEIHAWAVNYFFDDATAAEIWERNE